MAKHGGYLVDSGFLCSVLTLLLLDMWKSVVELLKRLSMVIRV